MNETDPSREVTAAEASWVRDQLAAVATPLVLDGHDFAGAGLAAGHVARRTRRWQQAAGGIAALAVAVAGSTVGLTHVLSRSDSAAPAVRLSQTVPATARGLAAAVLADLPDGSHVSSVGGARESDGATSRFLEADVSLSGGGSESRLAVEVGPVREIWDSVARAGSCMAGARVSGELSCTDNEAPGGGRLYEVRHADAELVVLLSLRRAVIVGLSTDAGHGTAHLPLPMSALEAIAADPRVGLRTTAAMERSGEQIEAFHRSAWVLDQVRALPAFKLPTLR